MNSLFNYNEGDTLLHRMSGLSKLLGFIFLSFTVMFTYDPRVVIFVLILSAILLKISQIRLRDIKLILLYIGVFIVINFFLTFLFAPNYGVELYGSETVWLEMGRYSITAEQMFYQVTKLLKYFSVIPLGILFLFTTNPSEFAASLNGLKVNYKISYALSLTLRYFPETQREYAMISKAQQARGIDISKRVKLRKRIYYALSIIVPLIFSTLDRVQTITNAMDLRGFAKEKKRTWYEKRQLQPIDWLAIGFTASIFIISLGITVYINGSRFYNPFI